VGWLYFLLLLQSLAPCHKPVKACHVAWAADDEADILYRQVKKSEYATRRFGYESSEWVPDSKAESKGEASDGK
jgi:hypothetical protein